MADRLQETLGVKAELIKGRGGVFKVRVGGRIVAEKDYSRGFPDDEECVEAVKAALG